MVVHLQGSLGVGASWHWIGVGLGAGIAAAAAIEAVAFGWRELVALLVVSLALALLQTHGGEGVYPLLGLRCALAELFAGMLAFAGAAALARRRPALVGGRALLAVACAAGALTGQAVLHDGCPVHTMPHRVLFHSGAVVVAAVFGLLAAGPVLRRSRDR